MALDARRRSSLYGKFVPILGEDDANALMSEFPASEADELVTKAFLRAEMTQLRSELQEMAAGLRSELQETDAGFHSELQASRAGLEAQVADLRVEMADRFRQQTVLFGGAFAAMTGVLGTLITLT